MKRIIISCWFQTNTVDVNRWSLEERADEFVNAENLQGKGTSTILIQAFWIFGQPKMGLQLISENSFILNHYITSYLTKPKKHVIDELWTAIDDSKPLWSHLETFAWTNVKKGEVSVYEAVYKLLDNPFRFSDTAVRYISLTKRKWRLSKPALEKLASENPNSKNTWCNKWIDSYYPNWPSELENANLYKIIANYECKKENPPKNDNWFKLKNNLSWLLKREDPKVRTWKNLPPAVKMLKGKQA